MFRRVRATDGSFKRKKKRRKRERKRGEKEFKAKPIRGKINNSIFSLSNVFPTFYRILNSRNSGSLFSTLEFHINSFLLSNSVVSLWLLLSNVWHARATVCLLRANRYQALLFIYPRGEFTTKICPLQIHFALSSFSHLFFSHFVKPI